MTDECLTQLLIDIKHHHKVIFYSKFSTLSDASGLTTLILQIMKLILGNVK